MDGSRGCSRFGCRSSPGALTPWPGWPASRLILARWAEAQLFVAIRGPRHDGHDFVAAALQAGAEAAVVVERACLAAYPAEIRGRLIAVSDTLAALQELARAVRRAWGRRIAAVTGSVGKTTTKEILAALLGAKFRVLKSEGNLNNEYGLPLTLLRLEPEDKAAVVELGMSHRGRIAAPGGDCRARGGRGHARCAGAPGVFRFRR